MIAAFAWFGGQGVLGCDGAEAQDRRSRDAVG
jgi:hypothetical protein